MYITFDEIDDTSRIWVYQCERELTPEEVELASTLCERFVEQWTAHQNHLQASFLIAEKRFLILSVNEEVHGASGCSIDSSVRFIQELSRKFNASFLDRRVSFEIEGSVIPLTNKEIKEQVGAGKIDENTYFFNNLVPDKGAFQTQWKIQAKDGWVNRFLKAPEATMK